MLILNHESVFLLPFILDYHLTPLATKIILFYPRINFWKHFIYNQINDFIYARTVPKENDVWEKVWIYCLYLSRL
jgi:hypothetical protein